MQKCNLSLQVIPLVDKAQVYSVVDKVIQMINETGVEYMVGPMETTMEGDLGELLEIVKKAQEICITAGADRILSVVKIDYSTTGVTMDEKVGKYR